MTSTSPLPAEPFVPWPYRWVALFVILSAEIMDLLDSLATTIAAPSIRNSLGGSDTLVQWLGAGYTVAMAIGLMTGGRLGDIFGRRRMFVVGQVGFVVGSVLCGVSQDAGTLIVARLVQGLFGAVMLPQGLGLIREMFDADERAKAFAMFGPVMGLGSVGGPILAGWLVSANYLGWGWRMIFFINVPIGIAGTLGALTRLPAGHRVPGLRLDVVGALLAAAGSFMLIFPLVEGREYGWPWWTCVMLFAGVVSFVVFGAEQARRGRVGKDTLIEPSLFRKSAFSFGLVVGCVFFAALVGYSLTTTLFFQIGLGWSALKAGLVGLPGSVGSVVGFVVFGERAGRLGRRLMLIGGPLFAASLVAMAILVGSTSDTPTVWQLAPIFFVGGFGMALFMAPFFNLVLSSVDIHENGSASGTLNAIQQLGSSLGIAVLGTVFFQVVEHHFAHSQTTTFGHAVEWSLAGAALLCLVGVVLTPLLPRQAAPNT